MNQSPRAVLGLNVGLAWDGKVEGRNDWLVESASPNFEADLTQVLHAERAVIQERNCLEYLSQRLEKSKHQLSEVAQGIDEVRRSNKQVRDKLVAALESVDAVNYRADWENAIRGEIATIAETT